MPTPRQLVDKKLKLATEYANLGKKLVKLKIKEAREMPLLMVEHSVAKAEREYNATDDGIRMMTIKIEMKSIEKLISAISSQLKVAENEMYNLS